MIIFVKLMLLSNLFYKNIFKLLIIFALMMSVSVFPQSAYAQESLVSSIIVEGNERIEKRTIINIADIYDGKNYSQAQINSALQRLKASSYFKNVNITLANGILKINVNENPTINSINFEGNTSLTDDNLLELISSKTRQTLLISKTEKDADQIASAYADKGLISARIIPKIIELSDNRVDLIYEIKEGRITEIEKITFVGNRKFSDTRLRGIIATKQAGLFRRLFQSDTYIEDRLEYDKDVLRDFYVNRGFIDFEVSTSVELTRNKDAFLINYSLLEGQKYNFGKITFDNKNVSLDLNDLNDLNKISKNSRYDQRKISKLIQEIEIYLSKLGINFIEPQPIITRDNVNQLMNIEIKFIETNKIFVERIEVEGNSTTIDEVIRLKFDFVEGDPFDKRKVQEAIDRIRGLGFFSSVATSTREGSSSEKIIIEVKLTEKPTGSLGIGAGYNSSDGSVFTFNINERNFLGKGQTLDFSISSSEIEKQLNLGIEDPSFLGRNLLAGISFGQKSTTPALTPLKNDNVFFAPKFGFPLSRDSHLTATYRYDQDKVKLTSASVVTSPLIKSDVGNKNKSAIILAYRLDKTNSVVMPTAGFKFDIKQEINGIGGDVSYQKSSLDFKTYSTFIRDDIILSSNLSSGVIIGDDADISNRFFLGGDKLKGFRNQGIGPVDNSYTGSDSNGDPLGGKFFTTINLESSFPIGIPEEYGIFGGVFVNAGSLWGLDNTESGKIDDSRNIRAAAGLSIFWESAIGPLRFNFSRPLKKETYDVIENFRFTVDTRF
ncbi:outer membrane protein assembly factor BamA [Amylibacter sp.]|nr:outer membrane protein assembly factor BamA [Amylibacter sp.]